MTDQELEDLGRRACERLGVAPTLQVCLGCGAAWEFSKEQHGAPPCGEIVSIYAPVASDDGLAVTVLLPALPKQVQPKLSKLLADGGWQWFLFDGGWRVVLVDHRSVYSQAIGENKTLAVAICRAVVALDEHEGP